MSLANVREYFETPNCLPQGDQSGNYLKRLDVINSLILPPNNPLWLYISKHLQSFKSFSMAWEQHQLSDSTLQSAKGFLPLQYLSLCASTLWKELLCAADDGAQVQLRDPCQFIKDIKLEQSWIPAFALLKLLGHQYPIPSLTSQSTTPPARGSARQATFD
jgi:hypothetical protein